MLVLATDRRSPTRWLFLLCLAQPVFAQQSEAEKLIEAGHWKKARAIVETRIHQNPNDALANYLLSQIRNAFGDYTSPKPLAEKAIALDSRVAKYHRQLAEVLGVEAQHSGPIKLVFLAHQFRNEIETAISLDPSDIQTQRDLLEYYLVAPGIAGGDLQRAVTTAKHISDLDPAEGFLARARIALFRKQAEENESLLRQAIAVEPPCYRAHLELAKYYAAPEHQNPEAAIAAARNLLRIDHSRVEPYAILAQIYAQRGEWPLLEATLRDSSEQVPDDLTPCYRAAEAVIAAKRESSRVEHYLRIYLEQEPEGNEPTLADARRKLTQVVGR